MGTLLHVLASSAEYDVTIIIIIVSILPVGDLCSYKSAGEAIGHAGGKL